MNEDIQSKMEFIINQQALFAANIQAHDERLSRLENIVTRLAEVSLANTENIKILTDSHIKLEDRLEESRKRMDAAFERLAESQAHTDKRLDALIDIVREERERRNRKSED